MKKLCFFLLLLLPSITHAQIRWAADGNSYFSVEKNDIAQYTLPGNTRSTFITAAELTPAGQAPLEIVNFSFSPDHQLLLVYTNAERVWRLPTRGDYWVMSLKTKSLKKLGATRPPSSLMFAKISPDGKKAAYVSQQNIYTEDLATGKITALTSDGSRKLINGTFDWVYEEEFACRDGFQWSPDSKQIAYWQVDASRVRDFYMINNTDSAYSRIVPVEYPTIGQLPSPTKIGVVSADGGNTSWLNIPGDAQQNYIPRIEWNSATTLVVQQLNRKQNQSRIFTCTLPSGDVKMIHEEKDAAWIDVYSPWEDVYALDFRHEFKWLDKGASFLWSSEKDGWRHLYKISIDGKKETLLTKGNFDVMETLAFDEKKNVVYFKSSFTNATQAYLYKSTLDGTGKTELVTPGTMAGTHDYSIGPHAQYAVHTFSNIRTKPLKELVRLQPYQPLDKVTSIDAKMKGAVEENGTEFFKVKTEEGVEMDGWMVKPSNFDPSKKYPVLFLVYTEPWGANAKDSYGSAFNWLYNGSLADDGYIYITIDNRGTPVPKGAAWRKSVYRKMGVVNIRDQALGAKEILKWPYVDASRVAVWGWSGGGSATLNLLFQYPDIYKTGIAVAAVANLLTYDNIYQERYVGLPSENMKEIIAGSPLTYAKNLKGNLLYIHGTGDDNVHYANAEMLLNELIKYNKQFQFMAYPNRTHSISEGEGTTEHLSTLYTEYLRKNCAAGGR